MQSKCKRDTNADFMKAIVRLAKENGWYYEAEKIMDYFLPESSCIKELSNYEFDFRAIVKYGGSEGIYLECYLEGSFDENDFDDDMAIIPCGTFKTLGDGLREAQIMGRLAGILTYYARYYVTNNFDRFCPNPKN